MIILQQKGDQSFGCRLTSVGLYVAVPFSVAPSMLNNNVKNEMYCFYNKKHYISKSLSYKKLALNVPIKCMTTILSRGSITVR
jgi:hypothetical protein